MQKSQVSAVGNTGDTVKTLIDTVTLIAGARKIVGFSCSIGGAGLTTLENISGMVELESSDFGSLMPQQYVLDTVFVLTNGVAMLSPRIWPMDIPCKGQEHIAVYVTMDRTMAINPTARAQFILEAD
jgi:hypothetical protein